MKINLPKVHSFDHQVRQSDFSCLSRLILLATCLELAFEKFVKMTQGHNFMGRMQIKKFSLCLALTLLAPSLSAIFSNPAHPAVVQSHGEFVLKDAFTVWKMADEGDFIKIVFVEKSAYFYLHKSSENFSSNMKAIQDSLNYGTSVFVEINTGSHEILNAEPKNGQPL